jgi:V/A-type H+-transporting ATPase subunit D
MSIKFQYNKTSLQQLNKQLQIRERALPTLKNKESALRMEVEMARKKLKETGDLLEKKIRDQEQDLGLWNEFDPGLVEVEDVQIGYRKLAGVSIPELREVDFTTREFNVFLRPKWFLEGIEQLEELMKLNIEMEVGQQKLELLEYARKKTTQKVNLYEKVQIPGYQDAIRKIKRFLEDEENLTKAAQKIVKSRQQRKMETAL